MITMHQFNQARQALTAWTLQRAARMARDTGMSYVPCADAPQTFAELLAEWAAARRESRGLKVWDGACDRTIYTMPEGNYAFRYLHDMVHAHLGLDFTEEGERATAAWHIKEVSRAFGAHSLEAQLIRVDTIGQLEYGIAHGGAFVEDQLTFAWRAFGCNWAH